MTRVHGTTVELDGLGVLIRGGPGSGKSDLALRLIDGGARLVADDQTLLARDDDAVVASCPEPLSGLLEVRGVGVVPVASAEGARLALVVELVPAGEVERTPEPRTCELLGRRIPLVRLDPFAASAAAKLRLVVAAIAQGIMPPP